MDLLHPDDFGGFRPSAKMPKAARPYKTLGYPVTPVIFILVGIWLLVNTLQTSPFEAGMGLMLTSLGVPVYYYFRKSEGD